MEHLTNMSYFLTACLVTAANPFLSIMLLIATYKSGTMNELLPILYNGIYSTIIITACFSPVLIILFAFSRLSKWHGT